MIATCDPEVSTDVKYLEMGECNHMPFIRPNLGIQLFLPITWHSYPEEMSY